VCDHDGRGAGDVDLLASARQGEGPGVSPWIWRIAALLALGVLAGATLGARLLPRLSNRRVRLVFLPVLVAIGLETLARGLGVGL